MCECVSETHSHAVHGISSGTDLPPPERLSSVVYWRGIARLDRTTGLPTNSGTVSRGARLYIPLAWYALQSLNLPHTGQWMAGLGAWLRIAQSLDTVTVPRWNRAMQNRRTLVHPLGPSLAYLSACTWWSRALRGSPNNLTIAICPTLVEPSIPSRRGVVCRAHHDTGRDCQRLPRRTVRYPTVGLVDNTTPILLGNLLYLQAGT